MTARGLATTGRTPPTCHLCQGQAVERLPRFETLARVTSDCRTWPRGGTLGVCGVCGTVQKVIDAGWLTEAESIYQAYSIYRQSNGVEQGTFDRDTGRSSLRSARIVKCLRDRFPLKEAGRLLDVGCGNGALLRAFAAEAPGWALAGVELDDKYRAEVESIPGVEALYTGGPGEAPGTFDLIAMIHALEHFADPGEVLSQLRGKLADDGLLLIEVPDHRRNPFELTIADHATHFSAETLAALIRRSGFEVVGLSGAWVSKELSLVARKGAAPSGPPEQPEPAASRGFARACLRWLHAVRAEALRAASGGALGVFGSSIAATWITGEVGEAIKFYVDEDPGRVGQSHLGRPIYHPGGVPEGSRVFVALPRDIAESIGRRLSRHGVTYLLPPAF